MPKKDEKFEKTSKHKLRLSTQVEREVEVFGGTVVLSNGVQFDHRDTVKKINNHKAGKFHNLDDDDAIFWPLGQQRSPHFAKKLDVDTRHFRVEGYGDYNAYQAWAVNVRFRKWAKDTGFALDLDDFGDALADFGSCALKLVERKEGGYDLKEVDLLKLWFDPTIKNFKGQTKIELHELEKHTVLGKDGWDNNEKAWAMAEIVDQQESDKNDNVNAVAEKRKFWERVGYYNVAHYENGDLVNGGYIEDPVEDDWKFMHTIHAGNGDGEVVVYAEEIGEDDDIYVDLHISKYEDRWLRIGVYERLFGLQKMVNESINYNRDTQQIASLLLLRTRNKKFVGSSILQMAESGLITDADLEQIGITNTAFGEFINTVAMYEDKADKLCLTPDVITGEGSNAQTFRGQAALTNLANSAFKKARDRVSFVISKLLVDRILPHEISEWNKEKSLEIAGFDVDARMYDAIAVIQHLNNYILDEFAKGNNPTQEEKQKFVDDLMQRIEREGRKLILPEKFYDFKFGLAINATGEIENKEQMNDAYFNVINWVLANPTVNLIPAFREYVEKNNITPFHLTPEQMQQIRQGAVEQPQPVQKQDKLMSLIDSE